MALKTKLKKGKTAVITTTISADLARWLKLVARKRAATRRTVLEDALRRFRSELAKQSLTASFRRARIDEEMTFLSEAGILDWTEQLSALEE